MKLALLLVAIASATLPQAWAQGVEKPELAKASVAYGQCVVFYSKKYTDTHELPKDIVAAAFGNCFQERNDLSKAIESHYMESGIPQPDRVEARMKEAERDIQRAAIRGIFEKRYPAIK